MTTPKTPKDFEYDLWTSPDGRYFMRVKRTGEVSEVNLDTFRFLRKLEKQLRREMQGIPTYGIKNGKSVVILHTTMLSLSYISESEDIEDAWNCDKTNYEEEIITAMSEQAFRKLLTEKQLGVYENCMIGTKEFKEYADEQGVDKSSIRDIVKAIRKKAKKFF